MLIYFKLLKFMKNIIMDIFWFAFKSDWNMINHKRIKAKKIFLLKT